MNEAQYLLVLNPGSSSLKFSIFEIKNKDLGREYMSGKVARSHQGCDFVYSLGTKEKKIHYTAHFSIKTAWHYVHEVLAKINIVYVGFRVVHGGEDFKQTIKLDKDVLQKIDGYSKLAPLHNPPAVELISLAKKTWPRLKMSASFDTAWYSSMEAENYLYAIPVKYYNKYGWRKYGFHGLSHEQSVELAASKLKKTVKQVEVISCHLGGGNSVTWYNRGKVIDTSMGFSPNEGLVMATRSGDISPDIVLAMVEDLKMTAIQIRELLNKESGLLGLAGTADLREILLANGYRIAGFRSSWKFSAPEKKLAKIALAKYVYTVRRYLGAYAAMAKHLDAIVFAGAVGNNSQIIRQLVLRDLNLPRYTKIIVNGGDENNIIAHKTLKCLS